MSGLAWRSARRHAASLCGIVVALTLGTALLSALTLILATGAGSAAAVRWFTTPDVVVAGNNTVSVTTGSGGDQQTSTLATGQARAVPAGLALQLSRLGATTLIDYAAYAWLSGAPGATIHPWVAATLHGFAWVGGGPPMTAGQIVLTAPTRYRPGDYVDVQTSAGLRLFAVSGVIQTSAASALYGTDSVARSLARGRISAVALTARRGIAPAALASRVRAVASGQPVRVLSGAGRLDAIPSPDVMLVEGTLTLLSLTLGVAGFVAVVVISGTFGYAVAARRRELGLLRAAGATPRQARRLVLGGALAASVLASPAGSAAGILLAGPWARWLARSGLAPAGSGGRCRRPVPGLRSVPGPAGTCWRPCRERWTGSVSGSWQWPGSRACRPTRPQPGVCCARRWACGGVPRWQMSRSSCRGSRAGSPRWRKPG